MQGTIIKGIGGFYYIKTEDEVIECKARGKFRYAEVTPMVGDRVEIGMDHGKGVIEKVFERSSQLIRPQVANVTQAFVVFALKNPDIDFELLNKFLVQCEINNIEPIICINKIDLTEEEDRSNLLRMLQSTGYTVQFINAKASLGVDKLKALLKDNVTVLCGPSGAGKSTLLNKLIGKEHMSTGTVSEKLGRGRHTTRHSELLEAYDGLVVDTPGFSTLELNFLKKEELKDYFPEFIELHSGCKFRGCLHYREPGCKVREAVENEQLSKDRYQIYVKMLEEISERRNNRW